MQKPQNRSTNNRHAIVDRQFPDQKLFLPTSGNISHTQFSKITGSSLSVEYHLSFITLIAMKIFYGYFR